MARHNSRPLLMRLTTTRTQGAFLISILLALVALTHTSLAQLPGEEIPLDSTARARGILWGVRMKAWVGGVHFSPSGSFLVATADSTYFLDPTNARVIKAFQKYGYTSISSDEQY
ncbi:MAG: hypothetical protein JNL32_13225, partial [Candidatus Kapabacteria bacterium]|nr:hypothetical protein [Candidatus Kapabacteria bacterium]